MVLMYVISDLQTLDQSVQIPVSNCFVIDSGKISNID